MAIDTSSEVLALEAEQAKLTRLYSRSTEAEQRIKTLKARHDTLEQELGAAAVDDNPKRVAAIRKEMQQIKDNVEATEIEELALRKAASEQSARVRALQEPVQRMKVEIAFRAWLEFLPQIEAVVAEVAPVVGPVASNLGISSSPVTLSRACPRLVPAQQRCRELAHHDRRASDPTQKNRLSRLRR